MVMTAFEANPETASAGVMRPSQASARLARIATRSIRIHSVTNSIIVATSTIPTRKILLSISARIADLDMKGKKSSFPCTGFQLTLDSGGVARRMLALSAARLPDEFPDVLRTTYDDCHITLLY